MWLRTQVDSRYHGGGPTQVNQAWCIIHFLHPNLISISFTAHPLWIHEAHKAQVNSNRQKKNQNYFWKGRGKKGGGGFLFLQKLSVSITVNAQWSAQWSTPPTLQLQITCKSVGYVVSDLCSCTWLTPSRVRHMAATQNGNVQLTLPSSLTAPSQLSS